MDFFQVVNNCSGDSNTGHFNTRNIGLRTIGILDIFVSYLNGLPFQYRTHLFSIANEIQDLLHSTLLSTKYTSCSVLGRTINIQAFNNWQIWIRQLQSWSKEDNISGPTESTSDGPTIQLVPVRPNAAKHSSRPDHRTKKGGKKWRSSHSVARCRQSWNYKSSCDVGKRRYIVTAPSRFFSVRSKKFGEFERWCTP